jgi:hypothetical protein
MVYDRHRKAPAMVGTRPMVNLTKEEAERIQRSLADPKDKDRNREPIR